jgi:hypothetical protein
MIIDYDKNSLIIDNKRTFIKSAALHYFRTPGAVMWRDRLSKLKAAGYNAVDLYFHWGYHSIDKNTYDFTGIKNIRTLLDITVELGMYVIARPGPYINAETNAGGMPLWLLGNEEIILRNRKNGDFIYSKPYMAAVKDWYKRIIPIINEYQNVIAFQIENEYSSNEVEPDYIQELHDIARQLGVKAPVFHNDAYCACLYSDIVNIYGCDIYPTIDVKENWKTNVFCFDTLDGIESNLRSCKENSPLYIAEMQAGWFDKYEGTGYEHIRKLFGREHINIVTKTALSQGVTMFNHYMGCGGTSWGDLGCDEVYSSYDFAAPVSEEGLPCENYYKAKEINYFLDSFNLADTESCKDDFFTGEYTDIYAKMRKDTINNCKWLFLRNFNTEEANVKLNFGEEVSIKPFDMKILPVGLDLYGCSIDFSGISILGRIHNENNEVLFLITDSKSSVMLSGYEKYEIGKTINIEKTRNGIKLNPEQAAFKGFDSCKFYKNSKTTEIVFIDESTSDKTWLFKDKALIGAEMIKDYPYRACFSNSTTVFTIDLNNGCEWKEQMIIFENNIKSPEISPLKCFKCAPEIDYGYDEAGWKLTSKKTDCASNEIYDSFVWYKGTIKGCINQLEISAKHCCRIYINGNEIYSHDSIHSADETITLNTDSGFFDKKENEITVLVQNLGFDKGFSNNIDLPRGVLSLKTFPEKEIEWKMRGKLTPEIEEWDNINISNLEDIAKNSYLEYITAEFELPKADDIHSPLFFEIKKSYFDRALIYLNGYKIGNYWENKNPQSRFYLIDEFLSDINRLSLIVWNKKDCNQQIKDFKTKSSNVNIKIGNYKSYKTFSIDQFF